MSNASLVEQFHLCQDHFMHVYSMFNFIGGWVLKSNHTMYNVHIIQVETYSTFYSAQKCCGAIGMYWTVVDSLG